MAVLLDEPERDRIQRVLLDDACAMSAATRVELGIVVEARTGAAGSQLLDELLARVGVEIVPVDARQVAEALACWRRFGKGRHPAALNHGDVFAYALARCRGLPLLCTGEDFAQTDIPIR